jgi:hypothetical protein
VKNTRDKAVSALSRDQLAELQRLLTSFADTAGIDLGEDPTAERVAEAERRAAAAEEAARDASERIDKAEQAAERRASEAEQSAERRASEAERAAERRASDAKRRAKQAESRAAADARAREEARRAAPARRPVEHYDDLAAEEVIALLGSLEQGDLQTLREYERGHANRTRVLGAIDSVLARGITRV